MSAMAKAAASVFCQEDERPGFCVANPAMTYLERLAGARGRDSSVLKLFRSG